MIGDTAKRTYGDPEGEGDRRMEEARDAAREAPDPRDYGY